MRIIDENYAEAHFEQDEEFPGTIDEWVVNSVVEIRASVAKEQSRKLFRLLALKYRCKFPIKGEKW